MNDAFYSRRLCKGLCKQVESGMCLGYCTTERHFVKTRYDKLQKDLGQAFQVIPYYEGTQWRDEALQEWFGQSQAQNENGEKLRLLVRATYSVPTLPAGTLASLHANSAMLQVLPGKPGGENIMPVYIKAESPLSLSFSPQQSVAVSDIVACTTLHALAGDVRPVSEWLAEPQVQATLRLAGFDSVVLSKDGDQWWAALSSDQYKSALGNNGQYRVGSILLNDIEERNAADMQPLSNKDGVISFFYPGDAHALKEASNNAYVNALPERAYQLAMIQSEEFSPMITRLTLSASRVEVNSREQLDELAAAPHEQRAYRKMGVQVVMTEDRSVALILSPRTITVHNTDDHIAFAKKYHLFDPTLISALALHWEYASQSSDILSVDQLIRELQQQADGAGWTLPYETAQAAIEHVKQHGVGRLPDDPALIPEILPPHQPPVPSVAPGSHPAQVLPGLKQRA